MSKELDYINEKIEKLVFDIAHPIEYNVTPTIKVKINDGAVYKEEVAILKRIKQRLESIDNANPSEAIKKLDDISYLVLNEIDDLKNKELWKSYFNTIKNYILKAQEQEKVLSIIKEKDVDIYILRNCKTVDEYNSKIVHIVGETRELTKEEFELLKRYFK